MTVHVPKVSVVMPVYNAGDYLKSAIGSILTQSFSDFEFLLVDDCSTDGSLSVCEAFARKDERIRLIRRLKNGGIVSALNDGLAAAKGAFIARMDADDVAEPERLKNQLAYLETNIQVGLCGTSIEVIDQNSKPLSTRIAVTDTQLVKRLLDVCSPVAHPTWLMRKAVIERVGGYRNVAPVEDYDFLQRVVSSGFALGNIEYVGLKYRVSPTSISSTRTISQRKGFALLHKSYLKGSEISENDFAKLVTASSFVSKAHAFSEKTLQYAFQKKASGRKLYVVPLLLAVLCSPYQARFVVDILRKNALIRFWPLLRQRNRVD